MSGVVVIKILPGIASRTGNGRDALGARDTVCREGSIRSDDSSRATYRGGRAKYVPRKDSGPASSSTLSCALHNCNDNPCRYAKRKDKNEQRPSTPLRPPDLCHPHHAYQFLASSFWFGGLEFGRSVEWREEDHSPEDPKRGEQKSKFEQIHCERGRFAGCHGICWQLSTVHVRRGSFPIHSNHTHARRYRRVGIVSALSCSTWTRDTEKVIDGV